MSAEGEQARIVVGAHRRSSRVRSQAVAPIVGLGLVVAALAACGQSTEEQAVDEISTICSDAGVELAEARPTADTPIRQVAPEFVAVLERVIERMESVDLPTAIQGDVDLATERLVSASNSLAVVARAPSVDVATAQFQTAVALVGEAFEVLEPLGVECGLEG